MNTKLNPKVFPGYETANIGDVLAKTSEGIQFVNNSSSQSGSMKVTFTENEGVWSCDTSIADICDALDNGQYVYGICYSNFFGDDIVVNLFRYENTENYKGVEFFFTEFLEFITIVGDCNYDYDGSEWEDDVWNNLEKPFPLVISLTYGTDESENPIIQCSESIEEIYSYRVMFSYFPNSMKAVCNFDGLSFNLEILSIELGENDVPVITLLGPSINPSDGDVGFHSIIVGTIENENDVWVCEESFGTLSQFMYLQSLMEGGGASATPDWNDDSDDDGYIKHRTHYIDFDNCDEYTFTDEGFDIETINGGLGFGYILTYVLAGVDSDFLESYVNLMNSTPNYIFSDFDASSIWSKTIKSFSINNQTVFGSTRTVHEISQDFLTQLDSISVDIDFQSSSIYHFLGNIKYFFDYMLLDNSITQSQYNQIINLIQDYQTDNDNDEYYCVLPYLYNVGNGYKILYRYILIWDTQHYDINGGSEPDPYSLVLQMPTFKQLPYAYLPIPQPNIDGNDSGKILTVDNSGNLAWSVAPTSLPSQTGNNGKFLTTDGSDASWAEVSGSNISIRDWIYQ